MKPRNTLNLLLNDWLPITRANGQPDWIAPHQITDQIDDPGLQITSINAPRPDFNGALYEFLIGLLTTACTPDDDDQWTELWETPPSPEWLVERFAQHKDAFNLDGNASCFMQDFEALDAEPIDISNLLIDEPGENTVSSNKDLFQKRNRITVLSRPAAAMALFTMQCYAPSGGQGHRTSMRGGGPLTTLVAPKKEGATSLWHKLWTNVETQKNINSRTVERYTNQDLPIFPWLAPTRTSNPKAGGGVTTPEHVNPLQVYWGMPRRINLVFEPSEGRRCDITGLEDSIVVSSYRTKNYGVEYSDNWDHPLSPHSQKKAGAPKLPIKGQPDGITYRHWLGLALETDGRLPASCITNFKKRAEDIKVEQFDLHCFGYDMDNAKARSWIESEMPAYCVDENRKEDLSFEIPRLIEAAEVSVQALISALKQAKQPTGSIKNRFWQATERPFYMALETIARTGKPEEKFWWGILQKETLRIFDDLVSMDGIEETRMEPLIKARYNLVHTFIGRNKDGKKLYKTLRMAVPPIRKKKVKAA